MKLDHSKINCFDMEMCCWDDGRTGEILSFGIVTIDLAQSAVIKSAHYFVRPSTDSISEYCQSLTGITPSTIRKQGRPLGEVLKTIQKNFGGASRFYACWGLDDVTLARECTSKGLASPIHHCLNLSSLYMLKRRHSGSSIGLSAAMRREVLTFEGEAHNALVDSENLARLMLKAGLV